MKVSCSSLFNIIFIGLIFNPIYAEYHSQVGQDRYVNENFFIGKRNGIFVDVGAYDGIHISNTYFFEKELGWHGICVEPLPRAFEQLKNNRSCVCLNCLVGGENGTTNFVEMDAKNFPDLAMLSGEKKFFSDELLLHFKAILESYEGAYRIVPMPVRKLNDILNEYNLFTIDFLSIDIEGGELAVLRELDLNKFKIHVMTIENNARETDSRIQEFMESKGFRFIIRLEQDEIYENTFFLNK